jgi:cysteine synthase A
MVSEKFADGILRPGESVVVESSSGNLGIGLAQICGVLGLRFICVADPNAPGQSLSMMRAYGAEVEVIKHPDPESGEYLPARIRRVKELAAALPNAFWPNQYANPMNARAHERTMMEISDRLGVRVDFLFCATSSCGTLRGCADYVRKAGLATKIIAVDAVGSAIFGGQPRIRRQIPGHGSSIRPALMQADLADEVVHVSDLECVVGCRSLVRAESILAGGSSGAVVSGLRKLKERVPPGSNCVVIFPDRGERYLDTIYCDEWVSERFGEVSHLWESRLYAGIT